MRILYIDVDSLRPDHLGCYGYHRDTSPTIDRLAAEGTRFTEYYAADVPCLPSRTGLFHSRFGIHTGAVNHGGINADVRPRGARRGFNTGGDPYRTLPTVLRDAGHYTTFVSPFPQRHGTWHTVDGFDQWIDTGGNGSERAEVVTPYALDWLDDHAAEEDWYLHVNVWDPHTPYDTPSEYGNPFADDPASDWPDQETIEAHYASYGPHSAHEPHAWGGGSDLERTPDEIADREDFAQWIDGYDVGIRYADDHIAKIIDRLADLGVLEETLIVISADHGENQGELNVYGDHQTADAITCRVPLIMRGPGIDEGVVDAFQYQIDFAPTIAELVDGTIPDGWDGESFAPAVTGGSHDGRDYLVVSQGAWACQRAVRWEDWLLIRSYHDGLKSFAPVELYDLATDPHETTNLARDHRDAVMTGLGYLESWVSDRLREAATDEAGGNADAPRTLVDPLFEVIHEGGPYHARADQQLPHYADRLRETGREEHAAFLERTEGVVSLDPVAYLDGDSR